MPASAPTSVSVAKPATGVRLPDFLVLGAMKASTTTFYNLASRHPDIWFASVKEPHYFTSPDYGSEQALADYAALFTGAPSEVMAGEASTGYTKLPRLGPTPARIRETLGEPRMIYLVRDPVERTISNYQHSFVAGATGQIPTLGEMMVRDPILITASLYHYQLQAYWDEFGEEALLVLTTDELHRNPKATMRRVEQFLGLSAFTDWPAELPASNSQQDLARKLAAKRIAPAGVAWAKRLLPRPVQQWLKRLVPTTNSSEPPISEEEIAMVQSEVEDDLLQLHAVLGDRIEHWPSLQRALANRGS